MTEGERLRTHPKERLAAPVQRIDLTEAAARLRAEPHRAVSGHRQIALARRGPVTLILFAFDKDGFLKEHQADGEVIIHCVRGQLSVVVGEESHTLVPGMLLTLAPGARVRWDWEMYGVGDDIVVTAFEPNKRVVFNWSEPAANVVEWRFEPHALGTLVNITNSELKADDVVAEALDLTQGWNLVLAAAKAWLEHGIRLDLTADRAPDHHVPGWEKRA